MSLEVAEVNKNFARVCRYLHWAMMLACIAVLGSCVTDINDVGGGYDANQKIAGIFFFHLFLIVPCLFGLFVFLRLKLEKYLLSKDTIESMNEAHMIYAEKEAARVLGPLLSLFKKLFKRKK